MKKIQAVKEFKETVWPFINQKDKPLRRMAWNDFTDDLCKSGRITTRQYETWMQPKFIQ